MAPSPDARVLAIIERCELVRPVDLERRGIPRSRLYGLCREGRVARQARGVYAADDHAVTAHHALVHVAKRVPQAVLAH